MRSQSSSANTPSVDESDAGKIPQIPHWIGGQRHAQSSGRLAEVTESATGQTIATVPLAESSLAAEALGLAREAAAEWGATSLSRRSRLLIDFAEIARGRSSELVRTIAREHGKVLSDAEGEVARGLEVVEFACGAGELLKGEISAEVSRGLDSHSLRSPLGVVAGITPFNFPAMVPMWMFPLALAAGNAFVLKPSEQDPSASVLIAEMLAQAGLPAGVFSVLHGDREAVEAILADQALSAVSFVGSTPVARHVYTTATANGKRAQALGGAKNHAVVLPDAEIDLAADGIVSAAYGSAGQRCMAISVAVAVGRTADDLVAAIAERAAAIVVGPSEDPSAQMGPVISAAHLGRVRDLVDRAEAEGADLVLDGRGLVVDGYEHGHFIGPCLLDRVTPGMAVYDQEVFGPVLCVVRVESFEEAMALVNASPYGNGASIFTSDGRAARAFERGVTAGMVGINVPIPVPVAYHSFGGWKDSLFGDLHVHGPDGVRFYTRAKAVTTRWPQPKAQMLDLGFPTSE